MRRFFVVFLCILLISGCSVSRKILDDITLVTFVGYDLAENDEEIEATIAVPIFEAQGNIRNEFFTSTGEFGKDLEKNFMLNTPKPLGNGKLEVTVFGTKFAEKGIKEPLDVAQRDPSISSNLKLAVYDGKVKEFTELQNVQNQDLGIYVSKIIEQNIMTETIPRTNIHLFFQSFYAEGMDPFLPLFTIQNGKIKMKGLALFKGDKFVDEIDEDNIYRFTMLRHPISNGQLIIKLKEMNAGVSMAHIASKRYMNISGTMEAPEIKLNLKLKGVINEFYGDVKGIEKRITKLEKAINKQVTEELEEMIRSFQEQGIDPVGFGKSTKAHIRNWDKKKWQEIYPDLDIKVAVKADILESGVTR
ncbi:Ger(x)C family spore germination protein [Pseudalkalibacillus sp. SCS-8]|uniref:Ger(x)C family spore germination protein n=1 Tax=Pseudalkalibacillus nanhaiensis TaxID=3115291 RepID=UPI0032D9F154